MSFVVTGGDKDSIFFETVMILAPSHSRSFVRLSTSLLAVTVCYAAAGGEPSAVNISSGMERDVSISASAFARLEERMNSAMTTLQRGREAYSAGKYEDALKEYRSALEQMPEAPVAQKRRLFISSSIADASVAVAQEYMKVGRYDEARQLLQDALLVKPENKLVMRMLEMLNDPIRNNPAKTPRHESNVLEVERLLAMGYGFFDLGQYDDADKSFESILKIDSSNVAARRGMEQVSKRKSAYYNAARDEARGDALTEVERLWEKPVPSSDLVDLDMAASAPIETGVRTIEDKLSSIILPKVDMQDIDLLEAVEFLRNRSISLDSAAVGESEKGVNIIVNLGDPSSEASRRILGKRFNLKLSHVPLKQALDYVASVTGTAVRPNAYTVEVTPASEESSFLITKVISVPPGFLSGMADKGGSSGAADDPFADPAASGSVVIKRVDPQEALKTMGVTFPQGAVARYNADSSSLFVRNTLKNIQAIEDIVSLKSAEQPIQVIVNATFIEVNETKLKELGFDWIISGNLDANRLFGGGGSDIKNPLNQGIVEGTASVAGAALPTGVVTGGLRSLNQVAPTDTVDALIQNGSRSGGSSYQLGKGPSFFTLRGMWNSVDLAFVMRGLNQKKGVDILQRPSVIVRPGEKALFFSGREMYYPEEYEAPQIPTNSNSQNSNSMQGGNSNSSPVVPSTPVSFTMKEVGTRFEVEVKGLSEDRSIIDLSVLPSIVDFDGFINYGSAIMMPMIERSQTGASAGNQTMSGGEIRSVELTNNDILKPIFTKKEVSTSLSIASGKTLILAGLKKAKNIAYEDKVPFLGDIPLVGRLFRSEGTHVERKVIIIMLKADVIDPLGKDVFTGSTPVNMSSTEALPASEMAQP